MKVSVPSYLGVNLVSQPHSLRPSIQARARATSNHCMSQVDPSIIGRDPPAPVDHSSASNSGPVGHSRRTRNRRRGRRPTEGAHVVPPNDDFHPFDLATPVDRSARCAVANPEVAGPASPLSPPPRRRDVKRGRRPPSSSGSGPQVLEPNQSESAITITSGASSSTANSSSTSTKVGGRTPQNPSRRKFGSMLTTESALATDEGQHESPSSSSKFTNFRNKRKDKKTEAPVALTESQDLTTRLIHSFTHKDDALDCPICFNSIHPAQPIWSCSPDSAEHVEACCWTSFHLKCIRSWAAKSTFHSLQHQPDCSVLLATSHMHRLP